VTFRVRARKLPRRDYFDPGDSSQAFATHADRAYPAAPVRSERSGSKGKQLCVGSLGWAVGLRNGIVGGW
jgi:hypothetical protein